MTPPLRMQFAVPTTVANSTIEGALSAMTYPDRKPLPLRFEWLDASDTRSVSVDFQQPPVGDVAFLVSGNDAVRVQSSATGFSFVSNPRIIRVQIAANDNGIWVGVAVSFSEPMDVASINTQSFRVLRNGVPVAGDFVGAQAKNAATINYKFSESVPSSEALSLLVDTTALASSGVALNTSSWDSSTRNAEGKFELPLDPKGLKTECGTNCYSWMTILN